MIKNSIIAQCKIIILRFREKKKTRAIYTNSTQIGSGWLARFEISSRSDPEYDDSIRHSRMTSYDGAATAEAATAAIIAYDDVGNDRESATAARGGRSPRASAEPTGADGAPFRRGASSFQFAVSSTSFFDRFVGFLVILSRAERYRSSSRAGQTPSTIWQWPTYRFRYAALRFAIPVIARIDVDKSNESS